MSKLALVLGAGGQLGSEIKSICSDYDNLTFYFADRKEIDLKDPDLISLIDYHTPDVVINCAAYTAVDRAETEKEKAFEINAHSLTKICEAVKQCGAILIHISSDYVYNIPKRGPLTEEDNCNPQGQYAISKYEGEEIVRSLLKKHIIIRTSWLYSTYGNNFVKTMIKLSQERKTLSVVADQFGAPTYARDLAETICRISERLVDDPKDIDSYFGTYNYANEGLTSWYDFAQNIFDIENIDVELQKTSTKEYNAPAPRPHWSLMSKNKIKNTFELEIDHWRNALKRMLENLQS
jgi:dTDP-4-dehydrorhamnose reductase